MNKAVYSIKELFLSDSKFERYNFAFEISEIKKLKNLSKINIFVGANNSGKSRFLRNIFIDKFNSYTPADINLNIIFESLDQFKSEISSKSYLDEYINKDNMNLAFSNIIYEIKEEEKVYVPSCNEFLKHLKNHTIPRIESNLGRYPVMHVTQMCDDLANILNNEMPVIQEQFTNVYIPTLRGLRKLNQGDIGYYIRTNDDYFDGKLSHFDVSEEHKNLEFSIFTGINMFDIVTNLLLGDLDQREIISDFQKFLSETFFYGQNVALIPSNKTNNLHVKIGEEEEKPIFDLGDGIQSLIILTFPLFVNKGKKALFFIEEPELFLHPGYKENCWRPLTNPNLTDFNTL